jgi:hypothetical protein
MPPVEFVTTIPVFERALNRAASVIAHILLTSVTCVFFSQTAGLQTCIKCTMANMFKFYVFVETLRLKMTKLACFYFINYVITSPELTDVRGFFQLFQDFTSTLASCLMCLLLSIPKTLVSSADIRRYISTVASRCES